MMLIRYQGQVIGFVGLSEYFLVPEIENRPPWNSDRRRVRAVCDWAVQFRRVTGHEPGRIGDRRWEH